MPLFKDNLGREWNVEINVGTTVRLKNAGINFYELSEKNFAKLIELHGDDIGFCTMLYVIVKPDADKLNVSDDAFYAGLGGDSLDAAWEAFKVAYINFIRRPEIRSGLKTVMEHVEKMEKFAAAKMAEASKRLEEIGMRKAKEMAETKLSDQAIEQAIDQAMNQQGQK